MKLLGSRSSDFQFLNYSRVQRNFTLIGATLLVKRSNLANKCHTVCTVRKLTEHYFCLKTINFFQTWLINLFYLLHCNSKSIWTWLDSVDYKPIIVHIAATVIVVRRTIYPGLSTPLHLFASFLFSISYLTVAIPFHSNQMPFYLNCKLHYIY